MVWYFAIEPTSNRMEGYLVGYNRAHATQEGKRK
jgi:hypothetical protein